MLRYCTVFISTLAVCFGLQAYALKSAGGRTEKSESNFFSSIGRIQAGADGEVEVMVLGSSITGRLPDRAQGQAGWANLGCDGGSAVDALRAMDDGILPTAPQLVIEANTLHLAMGEAPSEIAAAMRRPWFRIGLEFPGLAAYARPAAFVYSKLLVRRTGKIDATSEVGDLGVDEGPQRITERPGEPLTAEQEAWVAEIAGILKRLEGKGTESTIVWLPPGRSDASPPPAWILELARTSGSSYWDLGQLADPGSIVLTDGVHMSAPSAAATVNSLKAHIPAPR